MLNIYTEEIFYQFTEQQFAEQQQYASKTSQPKTTPKFIPIKSRPQGIGKLTTHFVRKKKLARKGLPPPNWTYEVPIDNIPLNSNRSSLPPFFNGGGKQNTIKNILRKNRKTRKQIKKRLSRKHIGK
jgi:hypothetical protein